ncbi:tRNA lysidine(34) synthetase TilS [Roseobacter ponti]|uniref:tRNA(Ile)-lysidine synthase n=1 Tax=Roseobacter ponti TaxID=1891787 RepID=A0A858SRL6_9RHOB|nr:tRNA lysidine(34) synthetase TilS [Roseobacter ponti]QJF50538.1 tRNA lysidine(34) synthetase TilS [Roseobacter ponti]
MSAELISAVRDHLPTALPGRLGVAVSGGSDSLALLSLLQEICAGTATTLLAVTVDHGLRPGAAREAAGVARHCAQLKIAHETLVWSGWDGQGNTQDAARRARYGLIAGWAQKENIPAVALGHTLNDQAETVLMRLARGAGVDGLSAMSVRREAHGVAWLRPLLGTGRDRLREYLSAKGIVWSDDPSNDDDRYDRIRARRALEVLSPLGLDPQVLCAVADNMRSTRDALDRHLIEKAHDIVTVTAGAVCIDRAGLVSLPEETRRRLLSGVLRWIGGAAYAPRASAVAAFAQALEEEASATLAGCHARRVKETVWIFREFRAVAGLETSHDAAWDDRWRLSGPVPPEGATLRALGDAGLKDCPDRRAAGLPRDLQRASPGLWLGERLLCAPQAGLQADWQIRAEGTRDAFFAALLSH